MSIKSITLFCLSMLSTLFFFAIYPCMWFVDSIGEHWLLVGYSLIDAYGLYGLLLAVVAPVFPFMMFACWFIHVEAAA